MARSTSTYGRKITGPVFGPPTAPLGLCSAHRTPILSDSTCWDCGPDSYPQVAPVIAVRPIYSATPAPAVRPNKFAGSCASCGGRVEAEKGSLTKGPAGWLVGHIGTCPAPVAAPAPAPQVAPIPDGRYAIASTGDNDLVFYRLTTSEKWGRSVQMIVGGHLDTYVARKNVAGILARIVADTYARPERVETDEAGPYTIPAGSFAGPEGAALRFADEIGRCARCNRHLTDRQSRLDGIGPVCITKGE